MILVARSGGGAGQEVKTARAARSGGPSSAGQDGSNLGKYTGNVMDHTMYREPQDEHAAGLNGILATLICLPRRGVQVPPPPIDLDSDSGFAPEGPTMTVPYAVSIGTFHSGSGSPARRTARRKRDSPIERVPAATSSSASRSQRLPRRGISQTAASSWSTETRRR